ncbi:unnamed protein product [Meloidogyne enterolobii]|uniref:Uncharacterized protein n=1 Tax=Meloidogyne enterolobii TaxID=390850 RepID=A0ACB0Y2L2_MELEN
MIFRRYSEELREYHDIPNEMEHQISDLLEEASSSEPKSLNQKKTEFDKHRQNFVNKRYLPIYKDEIWSPTENDFKWYLIKLKSFIIIQEGVNHLFIYSFVFPFSVDVVSHQ